MDKVSFRETVAALALAFAWSFTSGVHPVAAQNRARLAGVVLDESGGVLPGVTVTVTTGTDGAEPLLQFQPL